MTLDVGYGAPRALAMITMVTSDMLEIRVPEVVGAEMHQHKSRREIVTKLGTTEFRDALDQGLKVNVRYSKPA